MKLSVDHVTRYSWSSPMRGIVQSHRLRPADSAGQRVLSWEVRVSGGERGGRFRDGAGDHIEAWTIPGPETEIEVRVIGEVETSDTSGVLRGQRETVSPEAYLVSSLVTEADMGLVALAESVEAEDALSLAHGLCAAVAGAIRWMPGVTHASSSAAEALALGEGVCQDHAHALIACARHRGIPARYVTGYLLVDSEGRAHDASHAWAELHVERLGWVGFDPTNGCCPDERYIRIGSGHDAQDAAPIRSVARGHFMADANEHLDVQVAVRAAQQ